MTEALKNKDIDTFFELVKRSGDSSFKYLQNVYSNHKLQEQGVSLGLAVSEIVLGDRGVCRVHGGGFAGTVQAFVPNDILDSFVAGIDGALGEGACHVLSIRPHGGVEMEAEG